MCFHVYVIMHVKDPLLSVVRVGHHVPLAGFYLSLYSLHMLNRSINMIQINLPVNKHVISWLRILSYFCVDINRVNIQVLSLCRI